MPILHKFSQEMKKEDTLFNQYKLISKPGKDIIRKNYRPISIMITDAKFLINNINKLHTHTHTHTQ